jgi:hypothetical protein
MLTWLWRNIMNNLTPRTYSQDHKLAKFILYVIIVLLVANTFTEFLGITIWIWGLNPIAYLVESARKHPHQHDKL